METGHSLWIFQLKIVIFPGYVTVYRRLHHIQSLMTHRMMPPVHQGLKQGNPQTSTQEFDEKIKGQASSLHSWSDKPHMFGQIQNQQLAENPVRIPLYDWLWKRYVKFPIWLVQSPSRFLVKSTDMFWGGQIQLPEMDGQWSNMVKQQK